MTIGLIWRRTARRIKRLKEGVLTISPNYSDRPTPDFLALSSLPPRHLENRIPARIAERASIAQLRTICALSCRHSKYDGIRYHSGGAGWDFKKSDDTPACQRNFSI